MENSNQSDTTKLSTVKNKNSNALGYIIFSFALAFGFLLGKFVFQNKQNHSNVSFNNLNTYLNNLNLSPHPINEIIYFVQKNYVDSIKIDSLVNLTIQTLLEHLDPHSIYIPHDQIQISTDDISSSFEGIGIEFRIIRDTVVVINTIPNGPSDKIGIQPGDRIIKVNDSTIAGKSIKENDVIRILRGPKGTYVDLIIHRPSLNKELSFRIERDVIPQHSIDYKILLKNNIGYIKLSTFKISSAKEFSEAVENLLKQGMKKLILDLRSNSGGSLDACIKILDHFFPENILLVYTYGAHRNRENFYSTNYGKLEDMPIVVLVDEFSASASEIVAGAIQDNDRGIIIGRRTFGKGLVQEQISLSDGSLLRLTVARYYTPSGRSIQRKYNKQSENYYINLYERILFESQTGIDTTHYDTTTVFYTKMGRKVYGKGGIEPDIHISHHSIYKNQKSSKFLNFIVPFAFDFVDKNRIFLKQTYPTCSHFAQNFKLKASDWEKFEKYIEERTKDKLLSSDFLKPEEKKYIENFLTAHIARNVYGQECFYNIILPSDEAVNVAIAYLNKLSPNK